MKPFQILQYAAAGIASFGLVAPLEVSAASPGRSVAATAAPEAPAILDVSLGEGGTLSGQVLDGQGAPLAHLAVAVRRAGTDVAQATTDSQGRFAVRDLKGGTYEVSSAGSSGIFRLWTAGASPPSATERVLLVAGPVTRGQYYNNYYPYRRMQGCRRPVTNGQVVMASLFVAGFGGLVTGVVIAAVNIHEQASGS